MALLQAGTAAGRIEIIPAFIPHDFRAHAIALFGSAKYCALLLPLPLRVSLWAGGIESPSGSDTRYSYTYIRQAWLQSCGTVASVDL